MNQFRTASSAAQQPLIDPLQRPLALRAEGRLQEALEALSLPGEFPIDFYVLRGDVEFELGQTQEAIQSYSTAIARDPSHIYAQGQLGVCLRRLQQWEGAVQAFEAVLRLDPHCDEVRLELAGCLLHLQRFGPALDCFDRCRSDASRRRALFGKAVALQLLRRFDESEKHYERLLAIDPRAEEALSNMIAMAMEGFELARVQKYCQRLLEINAHSLAALKGLALAAIERRDYPAAVGYFYQVADREPGLTLPSVGPADAVEYRISRKVLDSLEESRRKQKSRAAYASSGSFPR